MKKRHIFLRVICLLMLFTLTGCGSKEAKTTSGFESIMTNYDYSLEDATDMLSQEMNEISYAQGADGQRVYFFVFDSESSAVKWYNNGKETIESYKSNPHNEISLSSKNSSSYSLTSSGNYYHICRIDNTLLYAIMPDSCKSDAKKLFKEFGY